MKHNQYLINQIHRELSLEVETLEGFIKRHLLLYMGKGDPQPNDETVLSKDLIEAMRKDQVSGCSCGRMLAYFDPLNNEIHPGINSRKK
jgi:hypothetical protein